MNGSLQRQPIREPRATRTINQAGPAVYAFIGVEISVAGGNVAVRRIAGIESRKNVKLKESTCPTERWPSG